MEESSRVDRGMRRMVAAVRRIPSPMARKASSSFPAPSGWLGCGPTVNISGVSQVDPLLHSDLVFQEMQQVHGLTIIPVDRVVEVYATLKIDKVESQSQHTRCATCSDATA